MVRFDVITDFCWCDNVALQTELAERMREQLSLPDPRPATGAVPRVSLSRLPAAPHGTQRFIECRRLGAAAEHSGSLWCSGRPLAVKMIDTSIVRVHQHAACIA